jgi:putative ATP-dependent endonuclease of the OLD family
MQIADLRIENFRGIRTGHVRFGPHTVFVGPNNCGKTTVIEALALLFGRDRMVRSLTEHDFFGGNPQPADRIHFVATIIDFEGDEPDDHTNWFRDDRGVIKWWNPRTYAVSATREDANWRLACQIGFCARFDRPSLEVETARYFHDDDSVTDVFLDAASTPVPSALIREVGFFLVPASRTWDRVVSFGSELFRRVVASSNGQPAESVLGERDRLRAPQQPLEADPRLEPIVTRLNEELAGFFRSQPRLHLRVTSTDSDGLLDAVIPHYAHSDATCSLPARRHGNGLISLQHLLLLLQFGRQRAEAHEGFWMALEEPELHVPPPLQRRLIHRIQALSTQTFVSTHSPMVAAMSDPRTVKILRNENGTLSCTALLSGALPAETPNAVRKLYQLNRVETIAAIMHDVVLVPEGRFDHEWLKLLVRAVDVHQGWGPMEESRFGAYVGVAMTQDAAIEATVAEMARLHPRVAALVDGDQAGQAYSATLSAAAVKPTVIVRWPDDWTMEDVVGWILEGDARALHLLGDPITPTPSTIAELVSRLKSIDRSTHGLKQDQVAYEAVADAIGSTEGCYRRARDLLNAVTEIVLGSDSSWFIVASAESVPVRIFRP